MKTCFNYFEKKNTFFLNKIYRVPQKSLAKEKKKLVEIVKMNKLIYVRSAQALQSRLEQYVLADENALNIRNGK